MAALEQRGILVLDVKREIRNADRLGWKMRAVFFEDERDRLADKVTANLQHRHSGAWAPLLEESS